MNWYTYWPISRRAMAYGWRYLRRFVADGPANTLNIPATIERTTRQGFFLTPVYQRNKRNHAQLLLLIDQGGSMMPFHYVTRDLVETAREQLNHPPAQVESYYFYNLIPPNIYTDPYLTQHTPFNEVLTSCNRETSVVVVSDGGAARGYRRKERIRATSQFLYQLKQRTSLIVWLNPMRQERWPGTSAQIIANLVPMFAMDADGFSRAIDVVRGQ